MPTETLWDVTPGPRTVWDRDLAGAGTETRWDLIPEILGYTATVVVPAPLYHVVVGRRMSMVAVDNRFIYATTDPTDLVPLDAKRPDEAVRPSVDWEQPLGDGITIASSVWAINAEDDDGSLLLDQQATTGAITSVRVRAGTEGVAYRFKNTITTSDQRTLQRELIMEVGAVVGMTH